MSATGARRVAREPEPEADGLRATMAAAFRIDVVPALFSPGNRALAESWGVARRVLVVRDGLAGERGELLEGYVRAAQARGELDDFLAVDADADAEVTGLDACASVVEAAVKVQLGRRDAVLAFGGERTGRVAAVAAASFRRFTPAVRVHRDLVAVVSALRDGLRPTLDGVPVTALTRQAHVIVDEDGVLAPRPGRAEERAVLLALALLDRDLLDRLGRAGTDRFRAEALTAILRLCRRLGPGHPAWRMGEAWLPLAPEGLERSQRLGWALWTAAEVGYRLGVLPPRVLRQIGALAGRLGLRHRPTGVDPVTVRRWLAGQPSGGDRSLAVPLPGADGGGEPVTVDRRALVRALARPTPSGPPAAPAGRASTRFAAMAVRLEQRVDVPASFPIRFVRGLLDPDTDALADLLPGTGQVLAVVDPYAPEQPERVRALLAGYRDRGRLARYTVVPLATTERTKTMDQVTRVLRAAEALGLAGGDRLLAIGGGTLLDLVGYAAYLYRHETPYIRVPTTLVGMIDAGVGLKVGVNVNNHKNLLGAYHPPLACLCDMAFLSTLATAELRCGLAEAIKIAVVCDAHLFTLIERHHADLLTARDTPAVREIVDRSTSAMLRQLSANPFEEDLRRLPDFGHEFGHALESLSGYRLRHGEAVAIGMALSCCLAARAGLLPDADLRRLLALLRRAGLALFDPVCDPDALWRRLHDEVLPHKAGRLHLVVPSRIGAGDFIDSLDAISPAMLRAACADLRMWTVDGER